MMQISKVIPISFRSSSINPPLNKSTEEKNVALSGEVTNSYLDNLARINAPTI